MPARRTGTQRRLRKPAAAGRKKLAAVLPPILREIFRRNQTPGFQRCLRDLLVRLCEIDTTPNPDVRRMQAAVDRCFHIVEGELGSLGFPGAHLEGRPVNPAIQAHPSYSLLHFTRSPRRPQGLSPGETYAGRSNLLYVALGAAGSSAGQSVALNAHIDVVATYFPPRVEGGAVFGRGACDDKGPADSIIAALRVLTDLSFTVWFERPPGEQTELLVRDCLECGLAGYVGLYGDKTKVTDPATGRPIVVRHHDFRRERAGFRVEVHGATGHMGAIRERDGAITKMAHLVRCLVASKAKLEAGAGAGLSRACRGTGG